jgi:hypothetical protein
MGRALPETINNTKLLIEVQITDAYRFSDICKSELIHYLYLPCKQDNIGIN